MKIIAPNWELIHRLLTEEYKRVESNPDIPADAKKEQLEELNRNNDYAFKKAEKS